ncbi:MAG: alpha/beta hydrolase, partial [Gammaproteobacteria bacterium]|nr:alpha/beta hydrolase [Gammaproteobacteria bacterium]
MSYTLEQWQQMGELQRVGKHRLFVVDSHPSGKNLPVLLLLHGFPTAGWDWHRQWKALTHSFRVIAPD